MKKEFLTLAGALVALLVWSTVAFASESVISASSNPAIGENVQVENAVKAEGVTVDSSSGDEEEGEDEDEDEDENQFHFNASIYASWWDGFHREFYGLNSMNVNQTWLSASRELDTEKNGLDWGFCVDAIFGTEIAQCADGGFDGNWGVSGDGYGTSIFQCYAEFGYENLSMKVGKFETELGYESVNGIDRMFNSTSYMYDSEPYTHSGVLGEWEVSERFSLNGGVTMGADNSFEAKHNYGFLFGGSFDFTERLSISYEGMANRVVNEECEKGSEYMHSIILGWDVTDRLNYTFVTSYGSLYDKNEKFTAGDDFGFVNYLTYKLTDKTQAGFRYEWFQAKEMPGNVDEVKNTYQELAFSLKCDVNKHMMIRPEIRYDWINEEGEKSDGFSGGIGGAIKF